LKTTYRKSVATFVVMLLLSVMLMPLGDVQAAEELPNRDEASATAGAGQFQFAKYIGVYKTSTVDQPVAWQWQWTDFVNEHNKRRSQGYYLVEMQTYNNGFGLVNDGFWEKGNVDQTLRWSMDNTTFTDTYNSLAAQGYRLRQLIPWTSAAGQANYDAIFDRTYKAQQWVTGYTMADLLWKDSQLRQQGYGMTSLQAYHINGNTQVRFLAIWNKGAPLPVLRVGYTENDFYSEVFKQQSLGYWAYKIQPYDTLNYAIPMSSRLRYNALFFPKNNNAGSVDISVASSYFSNHFNNLVPLGSRLISQHRAQYVIQQPSAALVQEESRSGSADEQR
jgi:hypothetical protein